ncbi:MAG: hypothetical protein P4M15_15540 [Alphaproteobacteria bacterium]|nr:hypothetical protein [Alphaproteobacteria bacterium]
MTALGLWAGTAYALWLAFDKLRVASLAQSGSYEGLPFGEQLWFLWHVDHKGRMALYAFVAASVTFLAALLL